MVDAQPAHAVVVDPARSAVGRVEDRRVLDTQAGQRGDREEAPVVLVGVGAAVADQLVVLPVVYLGAGRPPVGGSLRGDREAVLEVAQLAVDDLQLPRVEVVAEHRQHAPARRTSRCRTIGRTPSRGRAAARPTTPGSRARRRRRRGWARCRRRARARAQPRRSGTAPRPPARRAADRRVEADDVVAVLGPRGRWQQRGQVGGAGAQCREVAAGRCGGVEVEGRLHLQPIGRRGRLAHYAVRCSTTSERASTEIVSPASRTRSSTSGSAVSRTTCQALP